MVWGELPESEERPFLRHTTKETSKAEKELHSHKLSDKSLYYAHKVMLEKFKVCGTQRVTIGGKKKKKRLNSVYF